MKLFIQEVQMDIKQGILYKYQRYVIAILLGCVLAMFYVTTCFHALDRGKISSMNFTLGDMLLYFFRGKEIYNPINGAEFMIPTEYMMLQFYLSYMIGDYILKDLLGVGKNILVRTQKRVFWWLSKCVWCVITVIGFYAAVYLSAVLICMITGGSLTTALTPEIVQTVCGIPAAVNDVPVDLQVLRHTVCWLPLVTSVGMALFQMMLALVISPVIAYIVNVALLTAAAYYTVPFLQGNSFMMLRNACCVDGGVNTGLSIGISVAVAVISIIIGKIYFDRMDILKKR